MTTQRATRERHPCVICQSPDGKYVGFAAWICKACGVFYRRSYKLRATFTCKRFGNCDLRHELRNVCRKCRIEALRNVGLRMFGNSLIVQSADGYPVSDVEEEDVPDESSPSTSQNVSPAPKPSNQQEQLSSLYIDSILKKIPNLSSFKELYKVVEAFLIFECNQRLICSMHQGHPIKDFESIPIDKCKQFELETASLQLGKEMVQKLVTNCFLTSEPEIALMITIAHKAFLTSRVFPTPGDTRVAYFVGFHLDISHLETFLNNQTDYERIRKVAWPLISKRFEVAERCRLLRPDIVEWSAFIGILLFEELARITPDNSLINQKRETLYAEFFQYLSLSLEPSAVAVRIIKLLSFTNEIKDVMAKLKDMYDCLQIFFWSYANEWIKQPE
ncbi:hypothetical protein M3Y95_00116800 [Aphelenchoides besseyi]|nr:hypothetical protein M3Y95_00116800 [Aphelenchoides besseyi]